MHGVSAFAMGYHGSIIQQAMSKEGFNPDAINIAQTENFLDDLATSAITEDFDGYAVRVLIWRSTPESMNLADKNTHFDDKCNYTELKTEWERLEANTHAAVKKAEQEGDAPGLLAILGMSLHSVEDFYAHSNWAENSQVWVAWKDAGDPNKGVIDATWFDVPDSKKTNIHTSCYHQLPNIEHDQKNGQIGLNKDYAGRPYFNTAYREAYYASEQWIALVESWVSEDFWKKAKEVKDTPDETSPVPFENYHADPSDTWDAVRHMCWYTGTWDNTGNMWSNKILLLKYEIGGLQYGYFFLYDKYIKIVGASQPSDSITDHPYPIVAQQKWLKIKTDSVWETQCEYWDIDPGGYADFFTRIKVDNNMWIYGAPVFGETDPHPTDPDWVILYPLPMDQKNVDIEYELWDDDQGFWGGDELCDISRPPNSNSWKYVGSLEGVKDLHVETCGRRGEYYCGSCEFYCWCCGTLGDGDEAAAKFDISISYPPYKFVANDDLVRTRAPPAGPPSLSLSANPNPVFLPGSVTFKGDLQNYSEYNQKVLLKRGHYVPMVIYYHDQEIVSNSWIDVELIATIYTNSNGEYSFTYNPSANTSYRAYAESYDSKLIASSNILDIIVLQDPGISGPPASPCDDNNKCTSNDRYMVRICQGSPIVCDDQNPDTVDSCDSSTGCVFTPIDNTPCDDGNLCTVNDFFLNGICVGGQVNSCDDGNPDSTDTCNPNSGCVFTPIGRGPADGTPCEDGNLCTVNDYYENGICMGGQVLSCYDGNPDTADTCNPNSGCVFTPIGRGPADGTPCDDGNLCTVNDYYQNGVCVGGQVNPCDDGNPDTVDTCDQNRGGCVHVPTGGEQTCPEPYTCMYESEAQAQFGIYVRYSDTPCYIDYPTSPVRGKFYKYCYRQGTGRVMKKG